MADMPAKFEGNDMAIGFNSSCLLEGLKAVQDSEVTLGMTDPARPGLLRAERFRYVIMPVNMQ